MNGALTPFIGYRATGFIFLLAVLILGLFQSLGPVLFASILTAVTWDYFFIPPIGTFAIREPEDVFMILAYFFVALITGTLTMRIKRHEERANEARRLKESEKLHQTILSSISHEIRTPLTAIVGLASALSDSKVGSNAQQRERLTGDLLDASDRLNHVVENLLDMSRLSTGVLTLHRDWHDLNDILSVTLESLKTTLLRHRVLVRESAHLPLIRIDFRLFEQALSNLLINAASYSPEGTEIILEASEGKGMVSIKVSDQGKGIPESAAPHIFEKFYRVPGSQPGGTGLGLTITKSIIEAHQGAISFEKRPTGGTVFTISLPLEKQPSVPSEASK